MLLLLLFAIQGLTLKVVKREGVYRNPLVTHNGGAPCIRLLEGYHYLTTTQTTGLSMWKSPTLYNLQWTDPVPFWSDSTVGRNHDFLAPEFWFLDGFCYYSVASTDNPGAQRIHVLKGGPSSIDPDLGPFTYENALIPSNFDAWAIDPTILQLENSLYLVYSGVDEEDGQCLFIAELDGPAQLSGAATKISCAEYEWEISGGPALRAPYVLQDSGKTSASPPIQIIYTGSQCSSAAIGILALTSNADPLLPSSWTKSATPIFSSNAANGVFGISNVYPLPIIDDFHNYIRWYFAFDAKSQPGLGCTAATTKLRVQRMNVTDGVPLFPEATPDDAEELEPYCDYCL
ncbi:glycosyl hydrolase [Flagelloscypha sp. PMI_526]|nr:glycosyl hydrolase [Flagelloscypha sp. PMI_526]